MDTTRDTRVSAAALLADEIGEVITVAEGAALLRVTRQTIYNLADAGEFGEVIRIGRAIRIPVQGFRSYVLANRTAAA